MAISVAGSAAKLAGRTGHAGYLYPFYIALKMLPINIDQIVFHIVCI